MQNARLKTHLSNWKPNYRVAGICFIGVLLLQYYAINASAQTELFIPEDFDKSDLQETFDEQKAIQDKVRSDQKSIREEIRQDQEFLREETRQEQEALRKQISFEQDLLRESFSLDKKSVNEKIIQDQQILREEMERIRIRTQQLMRDVAFAMKEESLRLKLELEALLLETRVIQKGIRGVQANTKSVLFEGPDDLLEVLKNMREETKKLTAAIKQILKDQKEIWKEVTTSLKSSLEESRKEMEGAKVDPEEALASSRLAFLFFQIDSEEAVYVTDEVLRKTRLDYKPLATEELLAELKEIRDSIPGRGKARIRNSQRFPGVLKEVEKETSGLDKQVQAGEENASESKLFKFSQDIIELKKQIKSKSGNPGTLLAQLGDAYLNVQRFMDSKKDKTERQKLLTLAKNNELLLGSYEQAAWAYKLALKFNKQNAETHLIIGKIYDEMFDGRNALMYAKLAHQIFKREENSSQMEESKSFIESLEKKYESILPGKTVHKG